MSRKPSPFRDARLFAGVGAAFGFFGSILGATPFGGEESGGGIFLSVGGILAGAAVGAAAGALVSIIRNTLYHD